MTWAKEQQKEYMKKYWETNKEELKNYDQKYRQKHKEKIRAKQKEYRQRPENKAKRKAYDKEYNQRPEIKKRKKELHQRSEYKVNQKEYRQKPEVKAKYNFKQRNRLKKDKNFNIKRRLGHLLRQALKYYTKTGKIKPSKKYGINYKKIIKHLKPFPVDISNYEIDHRKPLCSFDLTNPEEIKKAFAPENHQWLTIQENKSKGGRYKVI